MKQQILQQCYQKLTQINSSPSLLLPGEMNISQLQGKIEFNTFLFYKPYN